MFRNGLLHKSVYSFVLLLVQSMAGYPATQGYGGAYGNTYGGTYTGTQGSNLGNGVQAKVSQQIYILTRMSSYRSSEAFWNYKKDRWNEKLKRRKKS